MATCSRSSPAFARFVKRPSELEHLAEIAVLPLHGDLPPEQQDRALQKLDRRKVVLATNVAETSVTVEGVTAVVDSGLARQLEYEPSVGMDRLAPRADLAGLRRPARRPRGPNAAGRLHSTVGRTEPPRAARANRSRNPARRSVRRGPSTPRAGRIRCLEIPLARRPAAGIARGITSIAGTTAVDRGAIPHRHRQARGRVAGSPAARPVAHRGAAARLLRPRGARCRTPLRARPVPPRVRLRTAEAHGPAHRIRRAGPRGGAGSLRSDRPTRWPARALAPRRGDGRCWMCAIS